MAKKTIRSAGRRGFAILLAMVLMFSLFQIGAIATGTEEDPYDVGDVVTHESAEAPSGVIPANAYWKQTGSSDAEYATEPSCGIEEHSHSAECYEACEEGAEGAEKYQSGTITTYYVRASRHSRDWVEVTEEEYNNTHGRDNKKTVQTPVYSYRKLTCTVDEHSHSINAGCYEITKAATTTWTLTKNTSSKVEFIQINFNGQCIYYKSDSSHTWLVQGTYSYSDNSATISEDGNVFTFRAGKQSGTVKLPVPEGAEIDSIAVNPVLSTNDADENYDCLVIDITITQIETPQGEVFTPGSANIGVTKIVSGDGYEGGLSGFEFELRDSAGTVLQTVSSNVNGAVSFAPISYPAPGTYTYSIVEKAGSLSDMSYDSHTETVTVNVLAGSSENGVTILYTNVSYSGSATFINTYSAPASPSPEPSPEPSPSPSPSPTPEVIPVPGKLVISKSFAGDLLTAPEGLSFTVSGPDGYSRTIAYTEFTNGSFTIEGLAAGDYTVSENGAEVEGYSLSVSGSKTASVANDTTAGISLTNTYTKDYVPVHTKGSITVSKSSEGADTPAGTSFRLQVKDGDSWKNVGEAVAYSAFVNGSYTFSDLGAGVYRVVESGAAVEGYDLSTANSGEVALQTTTADNGDTSVGSGTISIVNSYSEKYVPTSVLGSITVIKSSTGAATPASATFQLMKKDGENWVNVGSAVAYSEFADGKYIFTNLEEGVYKVVESGAEVAGYTLTTASGGSAILVKSTSDLGDTAVSSGRIEVTNTYSQNIVIVPEPPTPPVLPIYRVSYQYVGEVPEGAPALPAATQHIAGSNVAVAAEPTLEGYVFSGWSTVDASVIDGSFTMPAKDVLLIGSWEPEIIEDLPDEDPPLAEIPDEDPPLVELPDEQPPLVDIPDEGTPLVELPDEEPPLAEAPQTGDSMALYLVLTILSGFGLGWMAIGSGKARSRG